MIYLDYAANTPADPAVLDSFLRAEQSHTGNPNAQHGAGRAAKERMRRAAEDIAELLCVQPAQLIYTSGASEANNLALKGLARAYRHGGRHIISTCLEHPSVSGALTALQEQGWEIDLLDIGGDGRVDVGHLKQLLRKDTVIVSVCLVDSELGTVQPVDEIAAVLKSHPGCRFHVDATQAVGKIPVDFGIADCMTFAPHKFYGLNGCGMLVKREGVVLEPLIHGGASTTPYRSGTPALALAVSMATALDVSLQSMEQRGAYVAALRKQLTEAFSSYPLARVNSTGEASPYILNLSVKGVGGDRFQQELDKRGVCVSVKSSCSVAGVPSRPVYAVTRDRKNALCSWRISLSHLTTQQEIEAFLEIFDLCYKELAI